MVGQAEQPSLSREVQSGVCGYQRIRTPPPRQFHRPESVSEPAGGHTQDYLGVVWAAAQV